MQLETMYSQTNDQVATLVLNRPQVLNCANEQWARDLNTLVDDLAANDRIRVVVLRGAGRAFCSGIDLTALSVSQILLGREREPCEIGERFQIVRVHARRQALRAILPNVLVCVADRPLL